MHTILFSMPGNEYMGDALADRIDAEHGKMTVRRFPDGESYVRIESDVRDAVMIVVCTLHEPDRQFLPLHYLARTGRDLGVARVVLVAPYLSYMRQDKRFHEGEALSSRYFADLVSRSVDGIVTVDPHLHRTSRLGKLYTIPGEVLHSGPAIAAWVSEHVDSPLLIGPDLESEQWVSTVAESAGAPSVVLQKHRHGDADVDVSMPDIESYRGRRAVLVDDIISSGATMVETLKAVTAQGFQNPVCLGIHAVFSGSSYDHMRKAGAGEIVTCNTIPHASNGIDVGGLVAQGTERLLAEIC
jgi:ribose-phosphate pyrophosphokinase